jgi:hypothetical protein
MVFHLLTDGSSSASSHRPRNKEAAPGSSPRFLVATTAAVFCVDALLDSLDVRTETPSEERRLRIPAPPGPAQRPTLLPHPPAHTKREKTRRFVDFVGSARKVAGLEGPGFEEGPTPRDGGGCPREPKRVPAPSWSTPWSDGPSEDREPPFSRLLAC